MRGIFTLICFFFVVSAKQLKSRLRDINSLLSHNCVFVWHNIYFMAIRFRAPINKTTYKLFEYLNLDITRGSNSTKSTCHTGHCGVHLLCIV